MIIKQILVLIINISLINSYSLIAQNHVFKQQFDTLTPNYSIGRIQLSFLEERCSSKNAIEIYIPTQYRASIKIDSYRVEGYKKIINIEEGYFDIKYDSRINVNNVYSSIKDYIIKKDSIDEKGILFFSPFDELLIEPGIIFAIESKSNIMRIAFYNSCTKPYFFKKQLKKIIRCGIYNKIFVMYCNRYHEGVYKEFQMENSVH